MSIDLKKSIRALRRGNQLAGFQIYQQFSKATYNSILRLVPDEDQAKDLLQESFIQAFEKIDTLENELAFGAWLKRIAINKALRQIRKMEFTVDLDQADLLAEEEELELPRLDFHQIKSEIDQLPAGCRTVFQLYYLEEFSHAEVAEQLEISVSNSKTQLRYAKSVLKKRLKMHHETR